MYRAQYLTAEVIVFWLTFHVMSFPNFFLLVFRDKAKEAMNSKDGGSDSD